MAMVSCPKCSKSTAQGGYAVWQIIVAICFFPIGLVALLAGRKPTKCRHCGNIWQAQENSPNLLVASTADAPLADRHSPSTSVTKESDTEACPHCGSAQLTYWRKLCMGPLLTVKCPVCGKKVGVSAMAWLAVGFVGGGILALLYLPVLIGVPICLAGCALFLVLYKTSVRLVPRE